MQTAKSPQAPKNQWVAQWGQRVKEEREDRGWTIDELAAKVEVHRITIFRIEKGELNPNDALKYRLAGVFKIRMDRLWAYPAIIPDFEAAS